MLTTPMARGLLFGLISFFAIASRVAAQNVLLALHDGKPYQVVQARNAFPYVMVGGKLVEAGADRLALRKAEEFLPVFISIHDLNVANRGTESMGVSHSHEFHFRAKFESPYQLDEVFLVLELNSESAKKQLFLYEIGNLKAHGQKTISLRVPMSFSMGSGHYHLHLFSGGAEVLHSKIPGEQREAVLDRMIAKRVAGLQDAAPQPFTGPAPEYPRSQLKKKISGQAVISLRVGRNGRVFDPQVKSATDPLFGEAALAASRYWRFLPTVKNSREEESQVDLPFNFTPPSQPGG